MSLTEYVSYHFDNMKVPLAIWIKVTDWHDTTKLKAHISPQEKRRAERFHFRRDHNSYVVAHALKRNMLSIVTEIDPLAVSFDINNYGKPSLAASLARPDIHFNLSHTNGLIAVAVAHRAHIGIDVEWTNPIIDTLKLARSYFAVQDTSLLDTLSSCQRDRSFWHLWTLKEAYIKATGKGLNMPLNSFHVQTLTEKCRLFDSHTNEPLDWIIHSSMPTPEHYLSVAIESRSQNVPEISLCEMPLSALS